MKRNSRSIILGLLLCLATAGAAFAVDFTEAADFLGGINFTFGPSVGTLDNGANTVAGALDGNCVVSIFQPIDCNTGHPVDGDTDDTFNLTVPAGFQITSLTVTTSNFTGPAGFDTTIEVDKQNPTPPPTFNTLIPPTNLTPNGTTANLVTTPFTEGVYAVSIYGQRASALGHFSLHWSVSMNLAPTVMSPAAAVTNLINLIADPLSGLVLTNGEKTSLTDKLTNVLNSIQSGQTKQAINQLQAFLKSVQTSLKTGKISAQTANTLTVAANAIIASLQ